MSILRPPYERHVVMLLCESIKNEQLQSSCVDICWKSVSKMMNEKGFDIGELDCLSIWNYFCSDIVTAAVEERGSREEKMKAENSTKYSIR